MSEACRETRLEDVQLRIEDVCVTIFQTDPRHSDSQITVSLHTHPRHRGVENPRLMVPRRGSLA